MLGCIWFVDDVKLRGSWCHGVWHECCSLVVAVVPFIVAIKNTFFFNETLVSLKSGEARLSLYCKASHYVN